MRLVLGPLPTITYGLQGKNFGSAPRSVLSSVVPNEVTMMGDDIESQSKGGCMDLGLNGARALITGGTRGIGRGCAAALADEGAHVFLGARHSESLSETARSIAISGFRATDLTEPQGVTELVDAANEAMGGLDILVCNLGGPPPGTFFETNDQIWEHSWNLVFMSAVRLARSCIPVLSNSRRGRVLFITSITARQPIDTLIASGPYRAAVTSLAKSLSRELASKQITVNTIAPSVIMTDRLDVVYGKVAESTGREKASVMNDVRNTIPMGRFGLPEEVGALCCFLASNQAGFITGQSIGIDGGLQLGVH